MSAVRTGKIGVIVADDHPSIRENLRYLLNAETGIEVVGVARDGVEAVELVRQHLPDVLILDEDMPGALDGLAVIRELRRMKARTRVVLYTLEDEVCDEARREGAAACVIKGDEYGHIVDAVHRAGAIAMGASALSLHDERQQPPR